MPLGTWSGTRVLKGITAYALLHWVSLAEKGDFFADKYGQDSKLTLRNGAAVRCSCQWYEGIMIEVAEPTD